MGRPWYSFYPADYGRDTGHLSLVEHGVYRVLMDHYYSTASLPAEMGRLMRLCRAANESEEAAVRYVLAAFFQPDGDGFRHKRIEAEIEKAGNMMERGALGGRGRAAAGKRQASQSQSDSHSENIYNPLTPGFSEFWKRYPRREARGPARLAYARALESASPETLIAGARAYAARRAGEDAAFTRLAATWLAQECWLDDVAEAPAETAVPDNAWDGHAAALVAEIGAAQFSAFFAAAGFDAGPPVKITAPAYLRDLIARKFSGALGRAFVEYQLEAA